MTADEGQQQVQNTLLAIWELDEEVVKQVILSFNSQSQVEASCCSVRCIGIFHFLSKLDGLCLQRRITSMLLNAY